MRALISIRIVWAIILSALLASSTGVFAETGFEAEHQTAQEKNPPGLTCTLRTEDGRTRFQQGEIIRVVVAFASEQAGLYKLNRYYQSRPSPLSFRSEERRVG